MTGPPGEPIRSEDFNSLKSANSRAGTDPPPPGMSLAFDFGDIKWGDAVEQCVAADATGRLDIDAESRLLAENSRDGINLLLKNVRYGRLGGARNLPEPGPARRAPHWCWIATGI